jgi:hypothetical protein
MIEAKKPPAHYVNNKELYAHLVKRKNTVKAILDSGGEKPPLDNYLGDVILKICNHLAYKSNFINYTFRNEMVGDAIENCVKVVDNFDPERGTNPFAYLTQISFNAFIRRIQIEQKQQNIKGKLIEEIPLDQLFSTQEGDDAGFHNQFAEYLRENNFMRPADKVKLPKKKLAEDEPLEQFMQSDDEE